MPRRWKDRACANLVTLSAFFTISACADLTNAPPPSIQPPSARSNNAGGDAAFTILLSTGSTDVFAEVALPYHSEDRLYWITASGAFSSYHNYPFHLQGQREFTFGPSGVKTGAQCLAPIKVFSSFTSTQWSAGACGSSDSAYTSAFPIRGNGKARRVADRLNACADGATHWSGPCRTYDVTTQTVRFALVESELVVTATPNPAASGETVTFRTATDPVSANGYLVPYRVTAWRWTPAGGAPTSVCTQTAKNCVRTLTQSGTNAGRGRCEWDRSQRHGQCRGFA
ncbi:hypothetical protein BH23GEM2_BH23GEM2_09510 [soil metagenome]